MISKEIKSGLKRATLINNTYMINPSMNSCNYQIEIKSGLKTATRMNNKSMNSKESNSGLIGSNLTNNNSMNNNSTNSLRDTTRKAANTAKRKWNEYTTTG